MRHLRASLVISLLWMSGCPSAGISDVACTVDAECPPGSFCPSDGVTAARCVAGVGPAPQVDAGVSQDAGEPTDSGEDEDAGRHGDGGHHDAGEPVDAGPPDAGEAEDAGVPRDAGGAVDAGESPDAGQAVDAGESPDAGEPADAGHRRDAGEPTDAGETGVDAGVFVDGGIACTTVADCPANGRDACIAGVCLPDPTWTQGVVAADSPAASSYTNNGNGTVTDNVTKLIWQQPMTNTMHTWADAETYCAGLSLGGYATGWRLPSVAEAETLFIIGASGPSINKTAFPSTPDESIWTATPDASGPGEGLVWVADFTFSTTYSEDQTTSTADARCVISLVGGVPSPVGDMSPVDAAAPPGRYTFPDGTVASSATVYDTVTQLTWQRSPPATIHSFADAATYCTSLSAGKFRVGLAPADNQGAGFSHRLRRLGSGDRQGGVSQHAERQLLGNGAAERSGRLHRLQRWRRE